MIKPKFIGNIFSILLLGTVVLLLTACGSSSENDTTPKHLLPFFPTPSSCNKAADPAFYSLEESIKLSSQIILAKVIALDHYVWNTPDGKAPSDLCTFTFDQYIPVQLQVLENFKGSAAKDTKVRILVLHENNSKPPLYLPEVSIDVGDEITWFLGDNEDLKREPSTTPLYYPKIYSRFIQRNGEWHRFLFDGSFKDGEELKQLILKLSAPPLTVKK